MSLDGEQTNQMELHKMRNKRITKTGDFTFF